MTVIAYLAGLLTLPALFVAIVAWGHLVGWYRQPERRWSAEARCAGRSLYIAALQETAAEQLDGDVRSDRILSAVGWYCAAKEDEHTARRWAFWCPWWPSPGLSRVESAVDAYLAAKRAAR